MPGPPPKIDPIRRNARNGVMLLPPEGRRGELPAWPLTGRQTAAEREMWAQLWRTPQAVAWERLGWHRTVARYCRIAILAEARDATAAVMGQAVALEDRLGLTPKAMRMLLWQVAVDEVAEKRSESPADVRGRLKAVD
jgi:hypothetical protein